MQQLTNGTLLQGGKYKIEQVLGQGGFGITYLAEQPMLGRKVAVKEFFMKELCNRDEETSHVSVGSVGSIEIVERFREKFLKEARLIACMDNNHIVRIYDIFEENGTAYYIMENLDGGSVDMMVRNGAMDEATALRYIRQIANALDYIHKQNILHLDVKPSNILLKKNGDAVLIDFGISKRYDEQGGQTSSTPAGVSKGYAPIEQYNQGLANFSPATDIYSLGATLYKMLTGNTPPEASLLLDDDDQLVKPDNISYPTWVAIEKAMEPRRKKRPQSIGEFLLLLGGEVVSTKTEGLLSIPKIILSLEDPEDVKPQTEETVTFDGIDSHRRKSGEKESFNVNGVEFNMVFVEGGTFEMKEIVSSGFFGLTENEIVQQTTLSDYMIGEVVVTEELWNAVMNGKPNVEGEKNMPMVNRSWNNCKNFVDKLSSLTGKKFRLPTEAEWEFAARERAVNNYRFSGSDAISDVGWCDNDGKLYPVALKKPNNLGIYDMSGGVWEWCEDGIGNFKKGAVTNPIGNVSSPKRICRGGSWFDYSHYCTNRYRHYHEKSYKDSHTGMRLAMDLQE